MKDIKFDLKYNHICPALDVDDIDIKFEYPKNYNNGDLAINCHSLVKQLEKSSEQIAQDIRIALQDIDYVKIADEYNGYVNIKLSTEFLMFHTIAQEVEFKNKVTLPTIQIWRTIKYNNPDYNTGKTAKDIKKLIWEIYEI